MKKADMSFFESHYQNDSSSLESELGSTTFLSEIGSHALLYLNSTLWPFLFFFQQMVIVTLLSLLALLCYDTKFLKILLLMQLKNTIK